MTLDASVADAHEVLTYLTRVLRMEETETVVTAKGEVFDDIPVKASDRNKAAELLGKRHRLFTYRIENENSGEINIQVVPFGDDDP